MHVETWELQPSTRNLQTTKSLKTKHIIAKPANQEDVLFLYRHQAHSCVCSKTAYASTYFPVHISKIRIPKFHFGRRVGDDDDARISPMKYSEPGSFIRSRTGRNRFDKSSPLVLLHY